jgi:ATP-dependent Clp endopeptidase proteolytic subunit ClpP
MKMIQIENRAGKLKLNDGVYKESADKLIEELETLYGPSAVAAKMVIGEAVCKADDALESVEVEINSPGGSVFEGQRIYNALRGMSARGVEVTTTVNGLAASMGSVIMQAGDKRQITSGSRIMIHEASTIAWGDARALRKNADLLEGISAEIAGIYAERTGGDQKTIRNLMFAETWMTADEAKENGFADIVIKDGKAKASAEIDIRAENPISPAMSLLAKLFPGKNESEIEALLSDVDSLRNDLTTAQAAIDALTADVTSRDQTIAEHVAAIAAKETRITDLETSLETAAADLAAKDQTIAAKDAEIEAAKASAGQLATEALAAIGQETALKNVAEGETKNVLEQFNELKGANATAFYAKHKAEIIELASKGNP